MDTQFHKLSMLTGVYQNEIQVVTKSQLMLLLGTMDLIAVYPSPCTKYYEHEMTMDRYRPQRLGCVI